MFFVIAANLGVVLVVGFTAGMVLLLVIAVVVVLLMAVLVSVAMVLPVRFLLIPTLASIRVRLNSGTFGLIVIVFFCVPLAFQVPLVIGSTISLVTIFPVPSAVDSLVPFTGLTMMPTVMIIMSVVMTVSPAV